MLVKSIEGVIVFNLKALDEHDLDYERPLEFARSPRERINWPDVRSRTNGSPFASAFFALVEELGIVPTTG
ncbi:MAG TPA: hypothetical protein VFM83_10260 [Gaiellaceae bacterium]|nr:hypothetical protein [Gaiellaceae bacterium]